MDKFYNEVKAAMGVIKKENSILKEKKQDLTNKINELNNQLI